MCLNLHAELLAEDAEDGSKIVHRRLAILRKHSMQALGWLGDLDGKGLEAHRRIDEVTQDKTSGIGLAVEKQGRRLVEERLGNSGSRRTRSTTVSLKSRVSPIVHLFGSGFAAAAFRALYVRHVI